jgi:hypothetical protein
VFENLLNTLKVFRRPGPINAQNKNHSLLETTNVPENVLPTAVFPTAEEPAPVAKQEDDLPLPYIIGGVAVILFILWRRRKKED